MGFSSVLSAAVIGLRVEWIRVEADISNGLPMFHMVGYLSSEVKEAADRVRTAIRNSHIQFPAKKTIVNLSPAYVRKRGTSFDLPIAVAVLSSLGEYERSKTDNMVFVGELGLDGRVLEVAGVLPIVMAAKAAGFRACVVPKKNAAEGALVRGIKVLGVQDLEEVYLFIRGEKFLEPEPCPREVPKTDKIQEDVDFQEMQGQPAVKRALEVAVAGGHNILMIGPPGSGKTMAAQRMATILPPLTRKESMEITEIYSISGLLDSREPLVRTRPFRSVHHTATRAALAGGGMIPVPGEISLAHGGVLFLDELPEFQKPVLEALRQPLEEHRIRITRTYGNYVFPADFLLAAAMNPCPCGCYPDLEKCTCTPGQIQHYLGKISQPFLDRIDICVEAVRVEYEDLKAKRIEETSAEIRERVCRAREIQRERYGKQTDLVNARIPSREIERYCELGEEEQKMMKRAFHTMHFTARVYHKVLKVARTIADLDGSRMIEQKHLREAIGYRTIDKKYWGR